MTDDALALAMRIVDDDLDRLDALDRSTGRRTTPPHELDQLGAQIVVQRLMEAHANQAALVRSKTEPAVTQDRDMHTAADQPPRAIRATQAAAPIGAKRVLGVCRDAGIRHLGGIARGVRRQSAQNRNAHEGSPVSVGLWEAVGTSDAANRKKSGAAFPGRPDPRHAPTWASSPVILAQ